MGWLWSDGAKDGQTGQSPASNVPTASPPPQSTPLPDGPPAAPAAPTKRRTKAASLEEEADAELQKLIAEINYAPSDYDPASERAPLPRAKSKGIAAPQRSVLPEPATDSPIDPVRLLPTTMSCRSAFDQAYHCQLPGGQLANVYRYGSLRNCKELWSNFWFCMRTNRGYMTDEERGRRIQAHYWDRQHKYRHGPSSDDVWKTRTDLDPQAFQGDWGELDQVLKQQQQEQEKQRKGTS